MPKVIAICPKEYPGVSAVFRHGEALGLWKHVYFEDNIPENDLLILGAWHPAYRGLLEKYNCAVYLTSTFGQMEFSDNQVEVTWIPELITETKKNGIKVILAGWESVAGYFKKKTDEKAFYCPYPFSEDHLAEIPRLVKNPYSIGIFLPCSPRKNTLNQILAADYSGLTVYTNLPYDFQNGRINKIKWLENQKYFELISSLKFTLHCTFTESFSYGAAESLLLGTLPIVSPQIADNLNLQRELICYQVDSVKEILRKINELKILSEEEYAYVLKKNQAYFRFKNEENLIKTKNVLDEVIKLVVK